MKVSKRKVLVRPRKRIIENTEPVGNTEIPVKQIEDQYEALAKDSAAVQEVQDTQPAIVDGTEEEFQIAPATENVQLDLSGVGVEISNDEKLGSPVCYSENCEQSNM